MIGVNNSFARAFVRNINRSVVFILFLSNSAPSAVSTQLLNPETNQTTHTWRTGWAEEKSLRIQQRFIWGREGRPQALENNLCWDLDNGTCQPLYIGLDGQVRMQGRIAPFEIQNQVTKYYQWLKTNQHTEATSKVGWNDVHKRLSEMPGGVVILKRDFGEQEQRIADEGRPHKDREDTGSGHADVFVTTIEPPVAQTPLDIDIPLENTSPTAPVKHETYEPQSLVGKSEPMPEDERDPISQNTHKYCTNKSKVKDGQRTVRGTVTAIVRLNMKSETVGASTLDVAPDWTKVELLIQTDEGKILLTPDLAMSRINPNIKESHDPEFDISALGDEVACQVGDTVQMNVYCKPHKGRFFASSALNIGLEDPPVTLLYANGERMNRARVRAERTAAARKIFQKLKAIGDGNQLASQGLKELPEDWMLVKKALTQMIAGEGGPQTVSPDEQQDSHQRWSPIAKLENGKILLELNAYRTEQDADRQSGRPHLRRKVFLFTLSEDGNLDLVSQPIPDLNGEQPPFYLVPQTKQSPPKLIFKAPVSGTGFSFVELGREGSGSQVNFDSWKDNKNGTFTLGVKSFSKENKEPFLEANITYNKNLGISYVIGSKTADGKKHFKMRVITPSF